MTDTPITPEPAKAQHDADTEAVVDAAAETANQAAQEQPAVTTAPQSPTAPPPAAPAAAEEIAAQEVAAAPVDTAAQPTTPQPTVPQPDYGHGSFGQPSAPAYAGAQQPPYATHSGAAGAPQKPEKKRNTGMIIATLAIGALIGGVAGAGAGVGVYVATSSNNATIKTVPGPQNITVNDANDATTVTAAAAKALPSAVTISVTGSSAGGTGSGVVLTADGYVLTNTHVVTLDGQASNVEISVQDNDGKLYTAKIVGTDPTTDLAVIKLDGASGLTAVTFADSSRLNVGDLAIAIGAPLGLAGSVTDGIVSALNRSISIASSAAPKDDSSDGGNGESGGNGSPWNFDFPGQGGSGSQKQSSVQSTISLPVIQTDASINPGNSGGALLNSKGELIGINVAIASAGGSSSSGTQSGSIGVGFAISANLAKRISGELIKNGSATHGLLGASVTRASKAGTVGAEVKNVTSGGAAAGAGLKEGDVIVNFDGIPIASATDLTAQVRAAEAGAKADITYLRDGQTKTATVTLGSFPAS